MVNFPCLGLELTFLINIRTLFPFAFGYYYESLHSLERTPFIGLNHDSFLLLTIKVLLLENPYSNLTQPSQSIQSYVL